MSDESFSRDNRLSKDDFFAALDKTAKDAVQDVYILDTVDSTNTYAKNLAKNGARHVTAVMAEEQTAGRGRLGRSFYSPARSGLYLSILHKPGLIQTQDGENSSTQTFDPALFTIAAAVAVARALRQLYQIRAEIKWVNDIYLQGKKICGILAEAASSSQGGTPEFVVIGIGVNVFTEDFPDDLREKAASLTTQKNPDRSVLAAKIVSQFLCLLPQKRGELIAEYRQKSCVLGKKITVIEGSQTFSATAADIDENGCLIVETFDKKRRILHSGEISIRVTT